MQLVTRRSSRSSSILHSIAAIVRSNFFIYTLVEVQHSLSNAIQVSPVLMRRLSLKHHLICEVAQIAKGVFFWTENNSKRWGRTSVRRKDPKRTPSRKTNKQNYGQKNKSICKAITKETCWIKMMIFRED